MNRDWESTFGQWTKPPGKTEEDRCKNAIKAIRNAIKKSNKLNRRSVMVFVQGSYRNRVNVRKESDVDIGVLCDDSFIPSYPEGTNRETFGNVPAVYKYSQFKDELNEALVEHFGRQSVCRGNKAIDIKENSYHVDADVAPFFEYRKYWKDGSYRCGVALRSDKGGVVYNYPERLLESWPNTPQHYENGVSKNTETGRSYKGAVRIIKSLRNEMEERGESAAIHIPGFLLECMVWNAPNNCFSHNTWDEDIQAILRYLWSNTKEVSTCDDWCEVNDVKYLFRDTQKWTCAQAHTFVDAAWDYIGVRR